MMLDTDTSHVPATPPATPQRGAGSAHDVVLRALGLVGAFVVVLFLIPWEVGALRSASFWGIQIVLDLLYVLFCRQVVAMPLPPEVRKFWQRVTFTGVFFAGADTLQTVLAVFQGQRAAVEGPVTNVLVAAALAALIWGLVGYPSGATGRGQLRWWLDAATIMACAAGLVWVLIWARTAGGLTGVAWLIGSGLIAGIAVIVVVGLVKLRYSQDAPFSAAAGNAAIIAGVLFAISIVSEASDRVPSGVGMATRLAAGFAFTAVPRIELVQRRHTLDDVGRRSRRIPHRAVPYFALVVVELLLLAVLAREDISVPAWGVVGSMMIATITVGTRQFVTLTDNDRLVVELDVAMQAAKLQERRFRLLVHHAWDMTMVVDADGVITYVSPSVERLLGYSADEVVGCRDDTLVHHDDRPVLRDTLRQLARQPYGSRVRADVRMRHVDRSWRWFELVCTNLLQDPHISSVIWNVRDVTDAHRLQERMHYDATHDPLTRLVNRAYVNEQLHEPMDDVEAQRTAAAVVVNLDDFHEINVRHGHAAGDAVLIEVAGRIRGNVRPQDTVARLAGDEFAAILLDITPVEAAQVAERIRTGLREPVPVDGEWLHPHASVGLAVGRRGELAYLLRSADGAMYKAKKRNRGLIGSDGGGAGDPGPAGDGRRSG